MADYQEYRRRILHRRWRRVFIIVALLALVALLSAIGILWKVLHRERVDTALSQNTILRQVTTDNTWNTVSYPLARQLRVQTLEDSTETALDFRMAALPASAPVEKSWYNQRPVPTRCCPAAHRRPWAAGRSKRPVGSLSRRPPACSWCR